MKKPTNQGKEWSPAQDAQLRKLAAGNTPTRVIALKMDRTPAAIQARASRIDQSLKPSNQSPYNRKK
jgi:hypothetical protein